MLEEITTKVKNFFKDFWKGKEIETKDRLAITFADNTLALVLVDDSLDKPSVTYTASHHYDDLDKLGPLITANKNIQTNIKNKDFVIKK